MHEDYSVEPFATGLAGIVDIRVGPDGAVYYMSHTLSGDPSLGDGAIFRIDYQDSGPGGAISDNFSVDSASDYTFDYLGGVPNPGFSASGGALEFSRQDGAGSTRGIALHSTPVAVDVTVEMVIVSSDGGHSSTGPLARASDVENWYGIQAKVSKDTVQIMKTVSGVMTGVGAEFAVPVSPGDKIGLQVLGSGPVTLEVFLNDVSLGARTDSADPIVSGSFAGIWSNTQGNGTNRIDDFAAAGN
jgi:hypothetical protein